VHKVFNAGPMHEVAGKRVEVKSATPKGSGPQGRGPPGALDGGPPGRDALAALGAAAAGGAGMMGRPMDFASYGRGGYMPPGG
jgi:heterogeneous nuclear ribonucleoprotein A1/A3